MSSNWIEQYNAVFFISLATLIIGFLGLIVRYALKSKCEHFSCCFGAFVIDRRVDLEVQEELAQMELGIEEDTNIKPHVSNKDLKQNENLKVLNFHSHKEEKDIENNK
jgi:hypothetical protein